MKKQVFFAVTFLACVQLSRAQNAAIAGWTFENDSGAPNNTPSASTSDPYGTASADSIGMATYATPNVGVTYDDIVLGASGDTGANGVADTTNAWRIRGQAGVNGAANGWSSSAPIGTQGAQFFASTTGLTSASYSSVQVTFNWYSTAQGEANLQFEFTTNGGATWNNLALSLDGADTGLKVVTNSGSDTSSVTGSYVSDTKANPGGGQDWFTGLTATITDLNALNNAEFGIEMVNASTGADDVSTAGTALNNTSGNWRFDNVALTAVAAPEPGTWAMLFGGLGFLAIVARGRRKSDLI